MLSTNSFNMSRMSIVTKVFNTNLVLEPPLIEDLPEFRITSAILYALSKTNIAKKYSYV